MSLRPLRGAFTPSRGYVCLRCRLPVKFQHTLRNQHTSHETIDNSNGADLDGDSDRIFQISPKSSTTAKTFDKLPADSRVNPKRKIVVLKSKTVDLPIATTRSHESVSTLKAPTKNPPFVPIAVLITRRDRPNET